MCVDLQDYIYSSAQPFIGDYKKKTQLILKCYTLHLKIAALRINIVKILPCHAEAKPSEPCGQRKRSLLSLDKPVCVLKSNWILLTAHAVPPTPSYSDPEWIELSFVAHLNVLKTFNNCCESSSSWSWLGLLNYATLAHSKAQRDLVEKPVLTGE